MADLLIVDDELGMRQFLTHLFQREGHTVRVAENGKAAIELLREKPADLILSDIRMPDMGGIEFLREARAFYPYAVAIMITTFTNVDRARVQFLLCVYYLFQKPFDNDFLK